MGRLIAREGKKMILYNVEAGRNLKKQFKNFTDTVKTFKFSIPKPVIDYILPVSIVIIIMIVGISCYILFKSMKDYPFMNMN